jgi:hypothetical protein
MGHSRAEKAKTHKRVVAIAAKRFREEGIGGIGIAQLMGIPLPNRGVRTCNHGRRCDRRDGWVGPKFRPKDCSEPLVLNASQFN